MRIHVTAVENIAPEVEAMHHRVESRAAQVYDERGEVLGQPLEDWLTAERETIWRPPIEVRQVDGTYVIEAAVAGVEPRELEVRATSSDLLITAATHHQHPAAGAVTLLCEFSQGPLFRAYHFAQPVDPARARADCRNGLLRITVPIARHPKP
jgi:HSP20 family molecular chaperone IbpA